jgi:filamentous hemagglutinin
VKQVEKHFDIIEIKDAAKINELYPVKPYLDNSKIIEFKTTLPGKWVRVHGPDNQIRHWMMKAEDIKELTANEIKDKFNIPNLPTEISQVNVPEGTTIRMGLVGPNIFGNASGGVQYEILIEKLPKEWFSKIGDL